MKYNIVDLFIFIVKRWWKMLAALAVFVGLGIGLAFILPPKFRSEVRLLPMYQETGLMGALSNLQSQLGISGLSIPGADAAAGEMLTYADILRSRTIKDMVIDSCNLIERMNLEDRAEAYSELDGMTAFKLVMPEQIFVIEVVGKNNETVADIANAYRSQSSPYQTPSLVM